MAGYIALVLTGLLCLLGLAYILHSLVLVIKGRRQELEQEGDPLWEQLEVKKAKRDLKSRKTFGVLLYSITFCSLLWYLFYYEPAPTYQVSSFDLYQEFREDKVNALAKYRGEFIAVTGKYVDDSIVFGSPAILLQTSSALERVQCNFEGSRAKHVATLSMGQVVSIKGRVMGKKGNVIIEKCTLTD